MIKLFTRHKTKAGLSLSWEPTPKPETSTTIDGRRFLNDVPYVLPKDASERQRLDFQHYLMSQHFGLYSAPLPHTVSSILDVACGTGRWGHEMAQRFPSARVVGLDLDDPPPGAKGPINYQFVKGNAFQGLPFQDADFAYVHQRFMVLATPAKQWPPLLRELVRVTAPKGYIELREGGGSFHNVGPMTRQLRQWWDEASATIGIDVSLMSRLPDLLEHVGVRHIQSTTKKVGVGSWAGRNGISLETDIMASLPALKPFLCQHANVTAEAFDQVIQALPGEWNELHTSYEYYVTYGQKVERKA
jgi:SAM-dependent methyltransferase